MNTHGTPPHDRVTGHAILCDCDWFVTDDAPGSRTRTRLTLDHTIETGHDVDSLRTELSTEQALAEFLE